MIKDHIYKEKGIKIVINIVSCDVITRKRLCDRDGVTKAVIIIVIVRRSTE